MKKRKFFKKTSKLLLLGFSLSTVWILATLYGFFKIYCYAQAPGVNAYSRLNLQTDYSIPKANSKLEIESLPLSQSVEETPLDRLQDRSQESHNKQIKTKTFDLSLSKTDY